MLERNKKKLILGLAAVLVVVIVVVAGVVVGTAHNGDIDDGGSVDFIVFGDNEMNNAFYVDKEINRLLRSDEGYTLDDAVNEYEKQMGLRGDEYKVRLGLYYARFIVDKIGDKGKAIEVLTKIEPLVGDDLGIRLSLYSMMSELYNGVDEGKFDYYNNKVTEIYMKEEVN